jgi:decaprenyl-phosphate phosphoribosyltransferase
VLDLAVVAVGFLMRAVAGGLAAGLFLSNSFLMVAGFGSLFMVAGKRYSELHTLGSEAGTRRSLIRYTDTYLRFVWSIAATSTALAYCLWAFEQPPETLPWQSFSIVPFVLGLLRYAVDIDAGHAAEPEDIVLGDRGLQAIGLVWFVLVCLGVLGV